MATQKMLLLNGPNLDMLGTREPEVYGRDTLESLEKAVCAYAGERGVELTCYQSNSESKLIDKVHKALGKYDGVVFNPGAYTHYSYALRDAIGAIDTPVIEVHLSDIDAREPFRAVSVTAPACVAQVKGLGVDSYCRAIDILLDYEDLPRLGEGFEQWSDMSASVIMAEADYPAGSGFAREEEPFEPVVEDGPAESATLGFEEAPDISIPDADMGALSAQRQAIVRAACEQLGVTALLVRDTPNIRWLTGFDGVFDEERAHALLVGPDFTSLHTDSRYSNALHDAAAATGSAIIIDEARVGHFQFAHQSLAPGVDGAFLGKLGFEDSITYAEFVKAAGLFGTAALVPTNDVVLSLRSVKSPMELDRLRAAQAITDAAFRHIIGFMRPGMTEREVQLELESYMMRCGADGLAFGSIVACGANGADPHAVPSDKRLEAGQCVVMDFGARAYGYCSDMTRVVFLGEPTGEMARAWDVLREANETVERMLRPGVTGIEAHETAERVLEEGGFGGRMGHGLGHGVGLECHELPVLNTRNAAPLVEGNVVTVEPGIYLPGEFGMRLEDCGVITADGYDVFSQLGHEMVVV